MQMRTDPFDTAAIRADYRDGVLRLVVPVAEQARPRKIEVARHDGDRQAISAGRAR